MTLALLSQALLNGVVAGATYALLAFGFGLVYFTTGVFHFAHGALVALAGYLCWGLSQQRGWPLPLAMATAVAVCAVLGALVETLLYRPLRARRASTDVLFLTSLGLYTVVANLLALLFGHDTKTLASLANPSLVLRAGVDGLPPTVLTRVQLATVLVALGLLVALALLLKRTRFGLAVRAYAANPTLAGVVGVDERRLLPAVLALGSALGAVAGLCLTADVGVQPDMGLVAVITGSVAVVLGGVGSLGGTAVGGLLLGLLQHLARLRLDARWEEALTFGVLILLLMLRPTGLFGRKAP